MEQLDCETVEILQSRSPLTSASDKEFIEACINNGTLFKFVPVEDRSAVIRRTMEVDLLIPSLHTFFEDLKYLEVCSNALRTIAPAGKHDQTIAILYRSLFEPPENEIQIQTAEGCYRAVHGDGTLGLLPGPQGDDFCRQFRYAYFQLWLSAMRNFHDLATGPGKTSRASSKEFHHTSWERFGSTARALGFKTTVLHGGLDKEVAKFLQRVRPSCTFSYDFQSQVNNITTIIDSIRHPVGPVDESVPDMKADVIFPPNQRTGIPYQLPHQRDRSSLFLKRMRLCSHETPSSGCRVDISSFYARRSVTVFFLCPAYPTVPGQAVPTPLTDMQSQIPLPAQITLPETQFLHSLTVSAEQDTMYLNLINRMRDPQNPVTMEYLESARESFRPSQFERLRHELLQSRIQPQPDVVALMVYTKPGFPDHTVELHSIDRMEEYLNVLSTVQWPLLNEQGECIRYCDARLHSELHPPGKLYVQHLPGVQMEYLRSLSVYGYLTGA